MNINHKVKLVLRTVYNQWFISLLLIAICFLSFYMIDNVMTDYFEQDYKSRMMESMFGCNPYQVNYIGYMDLMTESKDNSEKLKEYIAECDGVIGCGYFSTQVTNNCIMNQTVNAVIIDQSIINLGNLKLSQEQKDALNNNEQQYQPVYVGYNLKKEIDIGDTFSFYGDSEDDCIVVGYLEKNASWPKEGDLFGGSSNHDSDKLNNSIVVVTNNYSYFDNYGGVAQEIYFLTEQLQDSELNQLILQKASVLTCNIKIVNEGDVIGQEREDNNLVDNKTFTAAVLLVVLAVVAFSSASVMYCLLSRKRYGIMIVCGLSVRELIQMVFLENAMLTFISAICVWLYRQWKLFSTPFFVSTSQLDYKLLQIPIIVAHEYYVPIIFIGCVLIMTFITGILPAIMISHMSLNELFWKQE